MLLIESENSAGGAAYLQLSAIDERLQTLKSQVLPKLQRYLCHLIALRQYPPFPWSEVLYNLCG